MGKLIDGGCGFARPLYSAEEMRGKSWDANQRAHRIGWERWQFIREIDRADRTSWEQSSVEGQDALEIWMMLDGKPLVPFRWPDEKVRQLHGLTRWRLERGMSPEAFAAWANGNTARTAEDERQRMQHRASHPAGGE